MPNDLTAAVIGHYKCPICKTTSIVVSTYLGYGKNCENCKVYFFPYHQVNLTCVMWFSAILLMNFFAIFGEKKNSFFTQFLWEFEISFLHFVYFLYNYHNDWYNWISILFFSGSEEVHQRNKRQRLIDERWSNSIFSSAFLDIKQWPFYRNIYQYHCNRRKLLQNY